MPLRRPQYPRGLVEMGNSRLRSIFPLRTPASRSRVPPTTPPDISSKNGDKDYVDKGLSTAVLHGTFWTSVARFGGKPFTLLSTVILIRLLSQDDFGIAAYAVAVTSFLAPLAKMGIGSALIYYREDRYSSTTAFWLSLCLGFLLFGIILIFAPLLADIFNDPRAVSVTRVLALIFPISALGEVQESLLQKRLAFQSIVLPNLARTAGKGVFSILLAMVGWSYWSLIWGQLAGEVLWVLTYWLTFAWRPGLRIVRTKAVQILHYGKDILATSLLANLLLTADAFFIGRYLGATQLGLYQIALRLPDLMITQFSHILAKAQFPVFVEAAQDPEHLSRVYLQTLRQISLFTIPVAFGLAATAKPFVLVFFTDEWLGVIPAMQILSLNAIFFFLHHQSGSLFKARGKLSFLLMLNIIRAIVLLPALWWSSAWVGSITAVALTVTVVNLLFTVVKFLMIGKIFEISAWSVVKALLPAFLCGALMSITTVAVIVLADAVSPSILLVASIILGAAMYIASSLWLQREAVFDLGRALVTILRQR